MISTDFLEKLCVGFSREENYLNELEQRINWTMRDDSGF